jgi:hypothetical protein
VSGYTLLAIEQLERRNLLTGVTLITHGFGGSVEGWVSEMGDAAFARSSGDAVRYVVEVTDPGHDDGPLEVKNIQHSGASLTAATTQSPDVVILLDWSDVAGSFSLGSHVRSTADVAVAVSQAFLTPNFLDGLSAPLVELPLHLIGHSRGGSLVGALAGSLGANGIWVQHVTTLDPHPVDGVRDPFGFDFDDAPMIAWDNVVFWDNYWRTDGDSSFDFTGEAIAGTHNVQLVESALDNFTGYATEHSDVHLWYHGTIDTTGPIDDGSSSVAESAGWYNGVMGPRAGIGYNYSRIGGVSRPADGIVAGLDGGVANRVPFPIRIADQWPNLLEFQLTSEPVLEIGDDIDVEYYWHDFDSPSSLMFFLDSDRNPYNGIGEQVGDTRVLPPTTVAPLSFSTSSVATATAVSGQYYLLAQIDDLTQSRFLYAGDQLELLEPPVEALEVVSLLPTSTGFRATFNQPIDIESLNLHTSDQPDIVLTGLSTGPVIGSVAINRIGDSLTFVKTDGLLQADSYSVTLRSAADGLIDPEGGLLDGDGDGVVGDDFTSSYSVAATTGVVVSLPNFVRGPGQEVHVPAEMELGVPISVSDSAAIRSAQISLRYDPTILNISAASVASGMPAGSTVTLDSSIPGLAVLEFLSPTALGTASATIINLVAAIPADGAAQDYSRGQLLDLDNITIRDAFGATLLHQDDDALHVAAFFGDVTGNQRVNAADASQLARVAALVDTGFAATPLVDPALIADISGNRRVNALDASLVAQFAALIDVPRIPPIPSAATLRPPSELDSIPWTNRVDHLFSQLPGSENGWKEDLGANLSPEMIGRTYRIPTISIDARRDPLFQFELDLDSPDANNAPIRWESTSSHTP